MPDLYDYSFSMCPLLTFLYRMEILKFPVDAFPECSFFDRS